jgi:hypothetical protein
MPDELRARLEEAAKAGSRSLHAEIVARLEQSFASGTASSTEAMNAFLEYQLASVKLEELRQWRLDAFFAKAVAGLVDAIARKTPETSEVLQGEIAQVQFFSGMCSAPPDEALSNASALKFQMDKRQALVRQLSLGKEGEGFSYADELEKTNEEIARLQEQQRKIRLPPKPANN